jgi:hypothetical protein
MRGALPLGLCNISLVTQTRRLRPKVIHDSHALCHAVSRACKWIPSPRSPRRGRAGTTGQTRHGLTCDIQHAPTIEHPTPVVTIGQSEDTCESAICNCSLLQVCCIHATVTYCKCAVSIFKWAPLLATYPSGSDKVGPTLLRVCCACAVSSYSVSVPAFDSDLHFA